MKVSEHSNDFFNGLYHQAEDWDGQPHWINHNRTAHIYFYVNSTAEIESWMLDDRDQ